MTAIVLRKGDDYNRRGYGLPTFQKKFHNHDSEVRPTAVRYYFAQEKQIYLL
jgi:hypothetical protein